MFEMNLEAAMQMFERFSEQLDEKEAIRVPTTSGLHQACAFIVNWYRKNRDFIEMNLGEL